MPPIELVVTDLDGTFWDDAQRLHPRTVEAVDELARRGVALLAATGRRLRSAAGGFARAGMHLPTVLLNGTHGHDFGAALDFHAAPFAADDALALLELLAAHGLGPCTYTTNPDPDAFVGPVVSTCAAHVAALGAHLGRADLLRVAKDHEILGFSILGAGYDELASAATAMEAAGLASVVLTKDQVYPGWSLMVAPSGVSKWTGVVAYCRRQGLHPDRVLAVGDGGNDVELLAGAAVAVAVEGGDARALAVAHHRVPPPEQGGWAGLLDLL